MKTTCTAVIADHRDLIYSAVWSTDGRKFATSSKDKTVRIWEVDTFSSAVRKKHLIYTGECHHLVVSFEADLEKTDVRMLSEDSVMRSWDGHAVKDLFRLSDPAYRAITAKTSPDRHMLVTTSNGREAPRVWAAFDGKELFRLEGHTEWVTRAAWSNDGVFISTTSIDGTTRVWEGTHRSEGKVVNKVDFPTYSTSWSAAGTMIVVGVSSETARIIDVAEKNELAVLKGHVGAVFAVAWSPVSQVIATGGIDGRILIFRASESAVLSTLEGHAHAVIDASWSPDGSTLATVSKDKTVRFWRVSDNS